MGDYHSENDEANTQMLMELAEACNDPEVAAVLACYTIQATGAKIRREMTKTKAD